MKLLFWFAFTVIGIPAQTVGLVERKIVDKVDLDSKPFETWMTNAAMFAAQMPWDPKAQSLLAMAEKATDSLFRLDSRRLRKKAAKANVQELGDMMMFHWDVVVDSFKGELILHDTAELSSYALRLRGPLSAEQMAEFLPRVVPYRFVTLIGPHGTRFTTPTLPRQFYVANSSQAVRTPVGDWIVVVHRSKMLLREVYPGDIGKERFPPFGERIHAWSLEKLAGALTLGVGKPPDPINEVLLREMSRRNPSNEFWKDVLLRPVSGKMAEENAFVIRFHAILDTLRRADPTLERGESFRLFIREAAPSLGDRTRLVTTSLNTKHCTPTNEKGALAQLEDPSQRETAIEYLGQCSDLAEVFDRIQSMALPIELEAIRANALRRIRDRQSQRN